MIFRSSIFLTLLFVSSVALSETASHIPLPPYQDDEMPPWSDTCVPPSEDGRDPCPDGWACSATESRCSLSGNRCSVDENGNEIGCDAKIQCGKCERLTGQTGEDLDIGVCDFSSCDDKPSGGIWGSGLTTCRENGECPPCWIEKQGVWAQKCSKDRNTLDSLGVGLCKGCSGESAFCNSRNLSDPYQCVQWKPNPVPLEDDRCLEIYRCKKVPNQSPQDVPTSPQKPSHNPELPPLIPGEKCTLAVVDKLIQHCCCELMPWGPTCNCTTFANEFHNLCATYGFKCESLQIVCTVPPDKGHMVNIIQLGDGSCIVVEPQGHIVGKAFPCKDDPPKDSICQAMGRRDCSCEIERSPDPVTPNTKEPGECARDEQTKKSQDNKMTCEDCCLKYSKRYEDYPYWLRQCLEACSKA